MKSIANVVLGVALALVAGIGPALAQQCQRQYALSEYPGDLYPSASAACEGGKVRHRTEFGDPGSWPYRINSCTVEGGYSISQVNPSGVQGVTWAGTILVTECTDPCAENANKDLVLNYTSGYSRSAADDAPRVIAVTVPYGGVACHNGCRVSVGYDVVEGWQSNSPTSSGLYRQSVDVKSVWYGSQCQASDQPSEISDRDAPPCVGDTTMVNGKPVCSGNAENPVRNDLPSDGRPKSDGNPTAGEKVEGSREPVDGDGGPRGGPGNGTGGNGGPGDGDGTVDKPGEDKEQQACGAPGQPRCRIDETGTPTGRGVLDGAGAELEASKGAFLDAINAAKEITAPEWTWTFQLPTACGPIDLGAFDMSIDICQWQPMIHDLLSIAWIAATIWFSIGLVGRTLGGS